jgi:predicted transcriptional regulator
MSELFPITIDVEDNRVGSVLRQLDKMPGIVNINLQMGKRVGRPPKQRTFPQMQQVERITASPEITPVEKRKEIARTAFSVGATSVKEVIARALGHGAMHRNLLSTLLEKSGFSPVTVNSTLTKMSSDKVIKRVGPGTYRLTKLGVKKFLQAPKPSLSMEGGRVRGVSTNNQKGLRSLILKSLARKSLDHAELKSIITNEGFVSNNIYALVPKMMKEGLIHRTNDTYAITDRGSKAFAGEGLEGSNSEAPVIEDMGYISHGDSA